MNAAFVKNAPGLFKNGGLIAVCLLYLLFSLPFIDRPGLQYDEVQFANSALGDLDGSFIAYRWNLGNTSIPVMLMTYVGAVKAIIYAPVFSLLPVSPMTVRLPVVILGLITLIITYAFTTRILNWRVALLAAVLLATDPSYVYHVRLDWGPVALMMFFKMSSLYCLAKFAQTKRLSFLAAGAFFLGIGLYDKANFIWYTAALPAAVLMVYRKRFLEMASRWSVLIAGFSFLLGCSPVLIYNIASGGGSFEGQLKFPDNPYELLQYKGRVLAETLDGSAVYKFVNREGASPPETFASPCRQAPGGVCRARLLSILDARSTLLPWVFPGAFIVLLLLALKRVPDRRAGLFFIVLFSLILIQVFLPYKVTGSHHMMMLYPFPAIITAHAVAVLIRRKPVFIRSSGKLETVLRLTAVGALVSLIASNIIVNAKYMKSFAEEGGKGTWSDAIYDLVEYAEQNRDRTYVLMDWGFNSQMLLLSRGSIDKRQIFGTYVDPSREDDLVNRLYKWTWNPSNVFVFHSPRHTQFKQPRVVFDKMLEKYGLTAEVIKVFLQRNGDPVYCLYQVSRSASADLERLVESLKSIGKEGSAIKWKVDDKASLVEIVLPPKDKNIWFNIERLEINNYAKLWIEGWAFIEGEEHQGAKPFIILKSGEKTYIFEAVPLIRKDITEAFAELKTDYNRSGFIADVPVGLIEDGRYIVGLYIKTLDAEAWHLSEKAIGKSGSRISLSP